MILSDLRRALIASALVALAGCRCTPVVTQVEPARIVSRPARLVLPATYVGEQRSAVVELVNEGGATAAAELTIELPFTIATERLSLVRGQSESVGVTFAPSQPGSVMRVLHVGALEVEVEAEALAVPECVAPGACVSSTFDFDALVCVEAFRADGTLCETSCVMGGCDRGVCIGGLKGCDDGDACTIDGCSETNGCSHVPRRCPAPTNPCQSARCDSASGCGMEAVPDGSLCGPDECKDALVEVCLAGACVQRARPATGRCANRWVPASIPGRASLAMAYDAARQRTVLFGGDDASKFYGDTWEWDGQRWSMRMPAGSPPQRTHHAMAYDSARRRIVLFGGRDALGRPLADTWEWDGVIWVQRASTGAPPARGDHAMTYDEARRRVVLFGGSASLELDDTWEWDGSNWSLRTPATSPSARAKHAIAYDVARQRVVLFGGGLTATARAETWEWDGTTWSQRTSSPGPAARGQHALVYDAARQRVLLVAGHDLTPRGPTGADFSYSDTWAWDGSRWSALPSGPRLTPRGQHGLAYDSARDRVVMFGGYRVSGLNTGYNGPGLSDTWEWDGASWTQKAIVRGPPLRQNQAMVNDPIRQRVVLTGGGSDEGIYSDVWEWDGATWSERIPPTTVVPDFRIMHTMAWDPVRQRVLLFGGFPGSLGPNGFVPPHGDTWEWDGTTLTQRMPLTSPPNRGGQVMVFDTARQEVVLFGGGDGGVGTSAAFDDTWAWDGTNWAQRAPLNSPPPGVGQAMAYDEARQRAVLFGGEGSSETWTWDGSDWLRLSPATSPSARSGHAMAWDPVRQRVVLYGGLGQSMPLDETWEWDGVTWLRRSPAFSPPASFGHSMAYDQVRERLVLFQDRDTWLFLP